MSTMGDYTVFILPGFFTQQLFQYHSFCVAAWISSYFLLLTSTPLYGWMYHSLFLHSPLDGPLGYFPFGAVTSEAAVRFL